MSTFFRTPAYTGAHYKTPYFGLAAVPAAGGGSNFWTDDAFFQAILGRRLTLADRAEFRRVENDDLEALIIALSGLE